MEKSNQTSKELTNPSDLVSLKNRLNQHINQSREFTALLKSANSTKMLPINKLADYEKAKKRTVTTEFHGKDLEKIQATFKKFEELGTPFDIPVPWGKLACKEFGKKGGRQILMVHGWLDNLNSFSMMVPNLLERMPDAHIVCFDEPGTGFSDGKPRGTYYDMLGTVIEMRRIIKHLGWDKVTLIGHSKGGFNCFIYAALFPQDVKQLVSCDLVGPDINFDRDVSDHIDKRVEMDKIFINDKEGKTFTKEYTKEQALDRLLKSRPIFNLSRAHGDCLIRRALKPYKDNFTFTRDIQWNSFSVALYPDRRTLLNYLEPMETDILNFVATDSPFRVDPSYWDDYRALYRRRCKIYEEKLIEGSHYIHMTHAEHLSDEIVKFINKSTEIRLGNKL